MTDTILEVGMWTWGWMEPPLGTISFFILCMQFAAQQRLNLGLQPFTEWLKSRKADQFNLAYPMYDRYIVRDYAKAICFYGCDADGLQNEPPWLQSARPAACGRGLDPEVDRPTPNGEHRVV